jgi:hypothetical protein
MEVDDNKLDAVGIDGAIGGILEEGLGNLE